jgi:hypothetical protein
MSASESALSSTVDVGSADVPSTRADRLRRLATALAIAAIGEAFGIMLIGAKGDPRFKLDPSLITIGFLATVVLFPSVGALIIQRRPFTRVAWLMIVVGVAIGFGLLTYSYGVVGMPPAAPLPFALTALVLSQLFFVPAIGVATTGILLLYPSDRLLSDRWRPVAAIAILASLGYVIGTLFKPGQFDSASLPGVYNPLGAPGALGSAFAFIADLSNLIGLGGLILALLSLVLRYRRADPIVAAQIRWLALVAVFAVTTLGISLFPIGDLSDLVFGLGLTFTALMPIAIGIAITRYRLYDIDRLINRALVYGSLTAILAGVFTAAVGLAQRLFIAYTGSTSDGAIVATTLVVATLYAPLRKRLEAFVDRWFKYESREFGAYRAEVQRFLELSAPDLAAKRLAAEAAAELDPVGLAVVDREGGTLATAGVWPQPVVARLPVGRGETTLGTLLIGPRRDGQPHDAREVEELAALAILVGTAAIRR